jgi:uncharacterized membrane protein
MGVFHKVLDRTRTFFAAGVLVVVPLILTYLVLRMLFDTVDGILRPVLIRLVHYYVPGLGILTTILLIILVGALTRSFIGAKIVDLGDRMLARVPIIRPIYTAARQLLTAFTVQDARAFKAVGLVKLPAAGSMVLCFLSHRFLLEREGSTQEYAAVYIPSTPAPVSGFTAVVPWRDILLVDLSVEEALKFFVSGGVAAPDLLKVSAMKLNSGD